jgi:hypothetical protein
MQNNNRLYIKKNQAKAHSNNILPCHLISIDESLDYIYSLFNSVA